MSSDVHAKWTNSLDPGELGRSGEALLQPVLDGLDVVIGAPFDRLDPRGIVGRELSRDVLQQRADLRRKRGHFGDAGLVGERHEPRYFDAHPRAYQSILAEMLAQRRDLGRVTAVERG